jgi:hypothetical protein
MRTEERTPADREREHEIEWPQPSLPDPAPDVARIPIGKELPADSVRSVPSFNLEGEDGGEEKW